MSEENPLERSRSESFKKAVGYDKAFVRQKFPRLKEYFDQIDEYEAYVRQLLDLQDEYQRLLKTEGTNEQQKDILMEISRVRERRDEKRDQLDDFTKKVDEDEDLTSDVYEYEEFLNELEKDEQRMSGNFYPSIEGGLN